MFVSGEGVGGSEAGLLDLSLGLSPSGGSLGNLFKSPQETNDESAMKRVWMRG